MPSLPGLSLRHAALIAGLAYLLNPVSYAEYVVYPHLVVSGDIAQTVQNIAANPRQFLGAAFCYLSSFVGDIVLAWSLYVLLAPINRSVALLGSWLQLIYAALALSAALKLVTVFQVISEPKLNAALGSALTAQVLVLLREFRNEWNLSLVLFGAHLVCIGGLILRSSHIPRLLGALLIVNGFGWILAMLGPYAFPDVDFGLLSVTFFGELLFMLWLLIRGWKITEVTT